MTRLDLALEMLTAIGIAFSVRVPSNVQRNADIEETLIAASCVLSQGEGERILGPLLSWIWIHGERVNMERLRKLMKSHTGSSQELQWIGAFAHFGASCGQTRWKLLKSSPSEEVSHVGVEAARRIIAIKGEESWSRGTGFLIPSRSAVVSDKNVLSPAQLARACPQYRNRLIFGTSWRADIATAIGQGAKTPTEAARLSGSSYEPAHRVLQELRLAEYEAVTLCK